MNIGIIVYSQTGNTLSVAQKLEKQLVAAGHTATIEQIKIVGEDLPGKTVQFTTTPDAAPYDALVFGSAVRAFSLSSAMQQYLAQIASCENKKVVCLVTQALPFPWMGGNRAIRQMKALCQSKGATVCGTGIINWLRRNREQKIVSVVDELSQIF